MRLKTITAGLIAVLGMSLAIALPAEASHRKPAGWGEVRTVRHYGYYPRYNHVYYINVTPERYAYRYVPRGYYPYYNSSYWRPADLVVRERHYALPPYYGAWGYPKRGYSHREWHHRYHGRHYIGHW
jgi:hypothetical protein